MSYRIGQVLYSATVHEGTGSVELTKWEVRTIRAGKVTAIMHNRFTWVKLSKAHHHWGWAPSIPAWMRCTFEAAKGTTRVHTTKRKAYAMELEQLKKGWISDDEAFIERVARTLQRLMKRK